MRKKRALATAYRPRSRWFTVERWMTCVGCAAGPHHPEVKAHDVKVGTRMRFTVRRDGTAVCRDCLGLQGIFEGVSPAGQADV